MTPEQQRIAIAEACGWTDCRLAIKGAGGGTRTATAHGKPPKRNYEAACPNYAGCLNAIHEAEKALADLDLYRRFLYLVVLNDPTNKSNEPAWATASQRTEAFLRTIGKWVES